MSVSIPSESHLLGLYSPQGNYKYETVQHDIILLIKITLYYAPLTLALEDLLKCAARESEFAEDFVEVASEVHSL